MTETLLHVFPSFATGGAQIRTIDLANTILGDKRHVFVALDRDFNAAEGLQNHVRHALLSIGCRPSGRLNLNNLRTFRRLLAERRPAMLITYNWGAIEAALANRFAPLCPHLHFEDGFGPDEATGRQLPRRIWARRLALSGQSRIVVPSKTLFNIARSTWRFQWQRLHYIPNGIDCERFTKPGEENAREPLRKRSDEILIGTLGTFRPEKNIARLLRLFARLDHDRPLRLVIVGDGPERASLETLAREFGIGDRTHFTGRERAPEHILRQLDVFALTSDTEQMPYCVIEAMASGLPIVATDVGDIRSMLPSANQAFVAARSDEARLGAQLSRLVKRPDLRKTIGDLNRSHAEENFDRRGMLQLYDQLFAELLSSRSDRLQTQADLLPT